MEKYIGLDVHATSCTPAVINAQGGACCPPGHADPTDPECVAEGLGMVQQDRAAAASVRAVRLGHRSAALEL